MAALFNLRLQQWEKIKQIETATQNEKMAARSMLEGVQEGSLVLMDLGYFGFELLDWLTEQKVWWVSRMRVGTSYEVITEGVVGEPYAGRYFL